jgi:BolA protein
MSSVLHKMIEKKLNEAFFPDILNILNESYIHFGHFDFRSFSGFEKETHFRIRIVSLFFAGMKKIDRHRAVNEVLKLELAHIHALALEAKAPNECCVDI